MLRLLKSFFKKSRVTIKTSPFEKKSMGHTLKCKIILKFGEKKQQKTKQQLCKFSSNITILIFFLFLSCWQRVAMIQTQYIFTHLCLFYGNITLLRRTELIIYWETEAITTNREVLLVILLHISICWIRNVPQIHR